MQSQRGPGAAGPVLQLLHFFLKVFPAAFALSAITTQTITYHRGGCFVTVKQMAKLPAASSDKMPTEILLPVHFELPRWLQTGAVVV